MSIRPSVRPIDRRLVGEKVALQRFDRLMSVTRNFGIVGSRRYVIAYRPLCSAHIKRTRPKRSDGQKEIELGDLLTFSIS